MLFQADKCFLTFVPCRLDTVCDKQRVATKIAKLEMTLTSFC